MSTWNGSLSFIYVAAVVATMLTPGSAHAATAEEILENRCSGCHDRVGDSYARFPDARRTPEGWDMTLARMSLIHDVEYAEGERATLVKYFADRQGLAPAETAGRRYILERQPGIAESPDDPLLGEMCGRCHSYARVALQRRTEDEWRKLAHFHMGQFPTIEYQALGRDRNWWEIASTEVPKLLAERYPRDTDAWSAWRDRAAPNLSGKWRIAGQTAGKGPYQGVLRAAAEGEDRYAVEIEMHYADGSSEAGSGAAILYTGHEWRGSISVGERTIHQVFTVAEDGAGLSGRWFDEANDIDGGSLVGTLGGPAIVGVMPEYLRAGETAIVAIHGAGLGGRVSLGEGVNIVKVISATPERVVVSARAAADAAVGRRDVSAGDATAAAALAVFHKVDSLRVEPDNTIARVGGGGGPLPPVPAQFDAIAYANGGDGEAGTEDDVRIGWWPAKWSVEPFSEVAAALEDHVHAGAIDAGGLFMPAAAGLNPARPFSTNNAGDLSVKATASDGGVEISGSAHLVVTVQRWNDPPIR